MDRRSLPFCWYGLWIVGFAASAVFPASAATSAHSIEFQGYFRTGVGMSEDGATQAEFQAPGSPTRYRLGNEPHTNIELAVDYRFDLAETDAPAGAFIQGYFMLDDFEPFSESFDVGLDHTAQMYIKFASYLAPGVDVWLGRRYYDRKFIGMSRHHWVNPGQNSHAALGIEGWHAGPGVLNAAVFRTEDPNVEIGSASGTINSTWLDLRYATSAGIADGKTTFWGILAQRAKHEALALDAQDGYGLGLWHELPETFGGRNTTALLYRKGAALAQGDTNPNPVREDQGYDLDRAESWEINNELVGEPGKNLGLQWAVIARATDFGRDGVAGSMLHWYSTGVRPVYYLSDHTSLALEASIDYVDDEVNDRAGDVRKLTLAYQLAKSRGYSTLPVLRVFLTQAWWSDDFKGLVGITPGDAPYGDETSGWTVGSQVEASW